MCWNVSDIFGFLTRSTITCYRNNKKFGQVLLLYVSRFVLMAVYGWHPVTVNLRYDFLSKIWKHQKHLSLIYIYLVEMKMHQCSTLKNINTCLTKKIKMLKFIALDNLKYIITVIPNKYIIITKKYYYLYFTHKNLKYAKIQHRF